jgi:Protein of unknown function (DUF3052)
MAARAAGYSGTPLAAKLGIKESARVCVKGAPTDYRQLLAPLPAGVRFTTRATRQVDLVHLFVKQQQKLDDALRLLRARLKSDAVVWVSWPKKSSSVATTVSEDSIRAAALPLGFVDVKVCAVNEVWSGLKLVVRKGLR